MNIVKGVADLIRRTSSNSGESTSGSDSKFPPPSPKVLFSDAGAESILRILWGKYENASEKVEKRKCFYIFVEQFLAAFKNWNPADSGYSNEYSATTDPLDEYQLGLENVVVGCTYGHPADVIRALTDEISALTLLITNSNYPCPQIDVDVSDVSFSVLCSEALLILETLGIINRSILNRRVFGYYGGIKKLTALMKGGVVQLKAIVTMLVGDDDLMKNATDLANDIRKILLQSVLVLSSFIDLNLSLFEASHMCSYLIEFSRGKLGPCVVDASGSENVAAETRLYWHQKAVISILEAGGLNWLVELLRVIRRVKLKGLHTEFLLQYLILKVLLFSLSENPRGQNHFKSIGGLEVVLDGFCLTFNDVLNLRDAQDDRDDSAWVQLFQLHILYIIVLREASFANLSSLQFICENGRIQKMANSFCSVAFLIHEHQQSLNVSNQSLRGFDLELENHSLNKDIIYVNGSQFQLWTEYVSKLVKMLCSFVAPDNNTSHHVQVNTGRVALPVSLAYSESSIKWFSRVIICIFPCIKASSSQTHFPISLRIFIRTLQRFVLDTLKKVIISSPATLNILREEGIWNLLFSESFFFFGLGLQQSIKGPFLIDLATAEIQTSVLPDFGDDDVEKFQFEVVSVLELAATSVTAMHNLPEISALLKSMEQSVGHPGIAKCLSKCFTRIARSSREKAYESIKTLNAIRRLLKIMCMQIVEYNTLQNSSNSYGNNIEHRNLWLECLESSMDLFYELNFVIEDAKGIVLLDSVAIDCLFDLFWEDCVKDRVLAYILELMKNLPSSVDFHKAKIYLCSKYFESFTQIRDRGKNFVDVSVDLLTGIREVLVVDPLYHQTTFRESDCYLHVVSLLNGNLEEQDGERLVLNVLQTVAALINSNDESKASFRSLVGDGYKSLQSLLLDFSQRNSCEGVLNSLFNMAVDGNFSANGKYNIQNEDAVILYLTVLQKSCQDLKLRGLDIFNLLLKDSISNRTVCARAGMLNFLLDWFSVESEDSVVWKIAQLIQIVGGQSISGKDIQKIFFLLRGGKVNAQQRHCSLLLTAISAMLSEKGPTSFFDLNGNGSGIIINTPFYWPSNKGFSFSCWFQVESFPSTGSMGLFNFITGSGKGCSAVLERDGIVYESYNLKQQKVHIPINLVTKKWYGICFSHGIGRALSGGSILRCYVDGVLVSSEKCRYAKVSDMIVNASIGRGSSCSKNNESESVTSVEVSSFCGQIGPVYLFSDALSSEQVQGIYSIGSSYMYSFLENDVNMYSNVLLESSTDVLFDSRDGLGAKIVFGVNAQAADGKKLFNVNFCSNTDYFVDQKQFEGTIIGGTRLCSRQLLQQILYCVGGISVFFPIVAHIENFIIDRNEPSPDVLLAPITNEAYLGKVIQLLAYVLDENLSNQQQMHQISGFSILGLLLQSVAPTLLNLTTFSALTQLFNVVSSCKVLGDAPAVETLSSIFLDPRIWAYAEYRVQRELFMFLINIFENEPALFKSVCKLPFLIDIVRQAYWDTVPPSSSFEISSPFQSVTNKVTGVRPSKDDIHKIRLLIVSLGEMSLRESISAADVKTLVAFFEACSDMKCVKDVLHMVLRVVSQETLLVSFVEQVNLIGGCHVFVNLLQRENESIRLLSLQFLGKLLTCIPPERKGAKFFNFSVGRIKALSDVQKKFSSQMQPIFIAAADRLFRFPLTDNLCATLFDVLLGGASPKQVLQKRERADRQRTKTNNSTFVLPQILVFIFRYLSSCADESTRIQVLRDLVDLLESTSANIEALMEYGWNAWLKAAKMLDVLRVYYSNSLDASYESPERCIVRSLFVVVLSYYVRCVKGGWQQLDETLFFLLTIGNPDTFSCHCFVRDILEELTTNLVFYCMEENVFSYQPYLDNVVFLLRVIDELLMSEIGHDIPFPSYGNEMSIFAYEMEAFGDFSSSLSEFTQGDSSVNERRNFWRCTHQSSQMDIFYNDKWWSLYDNVWTIICTINGKGPYKKVSKHPSSLGSSLGQTARGLVESLNVPATDVAAVVAGGMSSTLSGKPLKIVDRSPIFKGERLPRILFRLTIVYLCKASLERASRCVQQIVSLLPSIFIGDDEQSKSKLHFFIRSLLFVRSQFGVRDDDARFHVISQLIRETVSCGKSLLATSIAGLDDLSNVKDTGYVDSLIQKERVILAVSDEYKYINTLLSDRCRQFNEQLAKIGENLSVEAVDKEIFEEDVLNNLSEILSFDDDRRAASDLLYEEQQQNVAEKWIHMSRTLMDERGPWSASPFPTHWKLDKTEDSCRRRFKLRQNYHFSEQLCHPPSVSLGNEEQNKIKNNISAQSSDKMKLMAFKGVHDVTDEANADFGDVEGDSSSQKEYISADALDNLLSEKKSTPLSATRSMGESSSITEKDTSEVLLSIKCLLVTAKRKVAGNLSVRKSVLHFSGEFLVEGTGGSSVFKHLADCNASEAPKGRGNSKLSKWRSLGQTTNTTDAEKSNIQKYSRHVKRHRRWTIGKIKAVHWTRFLLRSTAIEIFFSDSVPPLFLNFATQNDAKEVGILIVSARNELLFPKGSYREKSCIISLIDRRIALEMADNATESWRKRDLTNFEYLMIINTLSGRSYNDLTQYPVFPWVIADYSSEDLDFNKSSTYRDLTKPIGALDLKRFEVFEDRYRSFSDPDIPGFYYGSHYSSMGIVLYYLLRLEPFTSLHRNLQGGKFDNADRLFHSIEGTYKNCLTNTSDVKELIPEFFYMPEFLINSNAYYLGVKQDGEPVNDIILPPWAKGSPEIFIHRNKEALESEFVSSNLHHWIDLVFGYKQRGKYAMEAANLFYYLTYEGSVDLESVEDDLQRSAIEDQIANFGQTPVQIFRKKHPRRGPPIPIAHPLQFAPASITLTSVIPSSTNPPSAFLYVDVVDAMIVLVNQGPILSTRMWLTTQLQSGGNFTFSGQQEPLFGVGPDILPSRKVGSPSSGFSSKELGSNCFATLQTPSENFLISCGNWENSFQVISLNDGRTVQNIRHHKDVVSCVAVTENGRVVATGSFDTTVMLWNITPSKPSEKRTRNPPSIVSETPFHVLCGHDDVVSCLHVSTELDVVISASKDGTCIFHSLRKGTYLRSLRHPGGCPLSKLAVSVHGRVAFYADDDLSVNLYSVNGKPLAACESNGRLNCMQVTKCGEFLVCGGDQGQVVVRSMENLRIVQRYGGVGRPIGCLFVTPEECFLVGTKDGTLLLYSIENPLLRRARNSKSKSLSPALF